MSGQTAVAPGARVVIRDEEWMVRRAQRAGGDTAITVLGLSELVRNKEAIFLTSLDEVRVLAPEQTELVRDDSPGHRQSRLYLEALLRRSPPTDARLVIGHRAATNHAPYQWEPAAQALGQLQQRILLADGVGLGKTIEVGVLLSELMRRGRGQRILVVALKSILAQFQAELWARFTIPLVRLDSVGIQRVQSKIPSNQNPFHYFDKVIVSIDTLKRDKGYRRYLENTHWDVVVIDECQNVADQTGSQTSHRARLAKLLARTCDALVLTSATPHNGKPASFASLISLLEPTAIADPKNYSASDVKPYFIRRFQKDVRHASGGDFRERDVGSVQVQATPAEERVFRAIHEARFETVGRSRKTDALFRTLVMKSWLSSPAACAQTLAERTKTVTRKDPSPARDHDLALLGELHAVVSAVPPSQQAKLQALFHTLDALGYGPGRAGKRVVIFSERIATLAFLEQQITRRYAISATAQGQAATLGQVAQFHGGLADQQQYAMVSDFSNKRGTLRVLLGSDAAAEGLNLHHACHHMVHYDVPWSLITLEQRNGRIDRYGQTQTPIIRYLLTEPVDPDIRGDLRVIGKLIEKEEAASKNLGDVAWLMKLHSAEAEERRITRAIQTGEDSEAPFTPVAGEGDWLQDLLDEGTGEQGGAKTHTPMSLFNDDLEWARAGLTQLGLDGTDNEVEWMDALQGFRLRLPDDLALRYSYLPPELRRGKLGEVQLTTDRARVQAAYAKARDTADGWPDWQLFWEQHPVAEWLNDRVLSTFRRHEAPVLEVGRGLAPGSWAYVVQGVVSNERSQPVLVDWSAMVRGPLGAIERMSFDRLAQDCGLHGALPNTGRVIKTHAMEADLGRALRDYGHHLKAATKAYSQAAATEIRPQVSALRRWRSEAKDRLQGNQETMLAGPSDKQRELERKRAHIDAVYRARVDWVQRSIKPIPTPYVRVAAIVVNPS